MMKQGDLFGGAVRLVKTDRYPNAPGWTEPTTSRAAAQAIRPHVTEQQKKILDFLKECGAVGATYLQITGGAGIAAQSVCGRMVELVEAERVTIAEFKRATPSGRQARVYLFAEEKSA